MTSPVLALKNIDVAYGKTRVLYDVSLDAQAGEVVALLGANGAGKSTTLRTISGLLSPLKGDIVYDSHSLVRCRPDEIVRRGIAHSPEERHIWPELTVQENLRLGAYICSDKDQVAQRLEAVLGRFPRLRERLAQYAGTLSGGEQQMLAIGRALMSAPKVLLLDEPSLGLSPLMAQEVLGAIRQLQDQGITVILVEQNVHNALSIATRAYVFETGRIVATNTAANLRRDDELMRAYLGA